MKIAVIGPGAMGQLFGGYLSRIHEVTLVGRREEIMEEISRNGIVIRENDGRENTCYPKATAHPESLDPVDLVVLFTKASAAETALTQAKNLIGPETYVLTMMNGAGHEELLLKFADEDHVLIGMTQHGSSRLSETKTMHSGLGSSACGRVNGKTEGLECVAAAFTDAGFPFEISDRVKGMIWNKLMINASSSVLSGVLQTNQGYVRENPAAWSIEQKLIREICAVASADGYFFDPEEQIARLETHLINAKNGFTSIYADLKNGRKTEVDVICGAVSAAGKRLGIPTPTQDLMIELVHAMEERK